MRYDDYVPAILSHIIIYHAEIKHVYVLTCVGWDFKCGINYVNGMAFLKFVKKTSKTCAVIREEQQWSIQEVAQHLNYDKEMMRQILTQMCAQKSENDSKTFGW
jgi:hypothetical protein